MMIIRKTNMDLLTGGHPVMMNAVQDDRYVRALELTLTAGGAAWTVPEDVQLLVSFNRPDGSCGRYDTLPNGEKAWNAEGNVLTVALAPQMMAQPGPVNVWITMIREEAQLSTFAMVLNVQPGAGEQTGGEEEWQNVTGFLPGVAGAAPGQFLRVTQVNAAGMITALEPVELGKTALLQEAQILSDEQKEQVRKNIGAASAEDALVKVTRSDDGKMLQVVDGVWTAISVAESAVKTFVDEYINSALEGEY